MKRRLPLPLLFAAVLFVGLLASPSGSNADCSSAEVVATILFSGDLTLGQIAPYRVSIAPVGTETYPSDAEIRDTLAGVYPSAPSSWSVIGNASPFRLWWIPPGDFGAEAIVDDRNGQVAFAGSVVFAGQGSVILPTVSTHVISELAAPPADPPTVAVLPNEDWDGAAEWPSTVDLAGIAAEWLRSTDLGHAFADCAPPWHVVAHVYTPALGLLDPAAAQLVVVARGRPGAPWGPVAVETTSWGELKVSWR